MAQGLPLADFPVLVVDDEQDNLDAIRFNFGKSFQLLLAGSGEEALALARQHDIAVIVTDQRMPRMTGLELLKAARELRPDATGIIVTAYTDVDVLIEAINLGRIYRYVTKPWDSKELSGILTHAIERYALLRENRRLQEQLSQYVGMLSSDAHGEFNFGAIVGDSPALRDVLARVEQVAQTASTVLLRGETGTGKEMVARAIHINSARDGKPFVKVNCAALAPGVLESELFGHEKGAFTGAVARRLGRFELADGGTLFLDEVGDLPLDVQVKLLRVLQEREFERVGGAETIKVDVRVVSATHRDLEKQIAAGEFREDLYYRLNVFPITLPPLRQRPTDIPQLAEHFIQKYARTAGKNVRGLDAGAGALVLRLARQRARARERHRARAHPRARHGAHGRRPRVHAPPDPGDRRGDGRARSLRAPPDGRRGRGRAAAAGAPAGAGARRDRLGHRSSARQHRARGARARHQPLDLVLPAAQARARAPLAPQGAGRRGARGRRDRRRRVRIAP
jgi:DNA-binding NtrC family response regulator